MKPIIFNDTIDTIGVELIDSKLYIIINDSGHDVCVHRNGLDFLIEALQKIKGELS